MIARLDVTPANPRQPPFQKPIVDIADSAKQRRHDPSNGMATFVSRYSEAQELARRVARTESGKDTKTSTKAKTSIGPLFETENERLRREYREEQARYFAEIHAYEHDAVKERLKHGFRHHFTMDVGGRCRDPFTEFGLRSETLQSTAGRYFVSCVPKRGRLRASMDKATLAVQVRSKLLSLDYPWIEANKQMMTVIRIDCDRVFDSPAQCLAALRELVGHRIPCLPHLVTGDLLQDGRYSRPHFYFLLPQGHAVWNDPTDKRCRMDIVRLFQSVSLGLTKALLELGADPCAPTLTLRGKNPLSPYWHTLCPNDTCWPTLSDYAGWVDMAVSREKLVRQATAVQTESGIEGSNAYFNLLRKEAFGLLREWHFNTDPRGGGEKGLIADELHQALTSATTGTGGVLTDVQRDLLIAKVADYAVGAWDVSKVETVRKVRGRLLHVTEGVTAVAKLQAAGAAYAAATKAERALSALTGAYDKLRREGEPVTQTAVAALAGVHRLTAVRRWRDVLAAIAIEGKPLENRCNNRCIDKKAGAAPATPLSSSSPADNGLDAPVKQDEPIATTPMMAHSLAVVTVAPTSGIVSSTSSASPLPWKSPFEIDDAEQWYSDRDNDDMAEIEAQESWLASQESAERNNHLEPDEQWFEEQRRAA
ncbi:hypothetical protein LB521_22935 [Mesorhizobium sp. BR-1-1-8]|uniref:hypothetical protein n=1 Tax=Mesorhizobium sp. BR-1-1-8 TaxID=2876659 RepID=UPI001CC93642|nr:hypothetical protein [Mesorhizobium sp. BR-1-1-8]MBZ9983994.1 hypothetical protein [Mesorhizobium sp. BR-1-1-8]